MANKKYNSGLIAFVVIIALAIGISIYQTASENKNSSAEKETTSGSDSNAEKLSQLLESLNGKSSKKKAKIKSTSPYIARLFITGTIQDANQTYNQEWLLSTIDELKEDDNNLGIILFINSPGGGVYQSDEVYLKLLEYKEDKPVYAYMASLAASGGYYIACAADKIMANRNTITGSIGVIAGQFLDLTELMKKYGINSETVHAGRNKNMGNYNEPITDEQRAIMQSMADECYEQFTGIVAESRRLNIDYVQSLADGRIYTAKQAKENKLIDEIGSWEDMVSLFKKDNELEEDDCDVEDFEYQMQQNFYRYFLGSAGSFLNKNAGVKDVLPDAVQNIIAPNIPFPAYYYGF